MRRLGLEQRFVYGPVDSRRLGRSLGVNISPTAVKHCSFGCLYCERGLTEVFHGSPKDRPEYMPSADEILEEIETALEREQTEGRRIDTITFAGNGEPTDHPEFERITRETIALRDRLMPEAGLALLSNARHVGDAHMRDLIALYDEPCMKLDAGDERLWRRLDVPYQVSFEEILDGLAQMPGCVIQTMLVRGRVDNSTDEAIEALIERLKPIRPKEVHLYSLDREPPLEDVLAVPRERLEEIAKRVQRETGTPVLVFAR